MQTLLFCSCQHKEMPGSTFGGRGGNRLQQDILIAAHSEKTKGNRKKQKALSKVPSPAIDEKILHPLQLTFLLFSAVWVTDD
jgi:hypothetical protein